MAQIERPNEFFSEVNVHNLPNGSRLIIANIDGWEPSEENGRLGLAIDGSSSMMVPFGQTFGIPGSRIGGAFRPPNDVEAITQTLGPYLCTFSGTGTLDLIYWACSPDGSQIESIGRFNEDQCRKLQLSGPKRWGRQTRLLPPLRYFAEHPDFVNAGWGFCVFISDGQWNDQEAVKAYSWELARQIAAGRRRFIKLVILGVGSEIDEAQMTELDDLFEGSNLVTPAGNPIDLWDHKLADDFKSLRTIFAEPFSDKTLVGNLICAPTGTVYGASGRLLKNFSDGVPLELRFELPPGEMGFVLRIGQTNVDQPIPF